MGKKLHPRGQSEEAVLLAGLSLFFSLDEESEVEEVEEESDEPEDESPEDSLLAAAAACLALFEERVP
jgi:hypothetical protein